VPDFPLSNGETQKINSHLTQWSGAMSIEVTLGVFSILASLASPFISEGIEQYKEKIPTF
jgi:hypothetical protein